MSAVILNFGRDPAKTLRRQLEQFWKRADAQAAQDAKTAEQLKYAAARGKRHEPDNGPEAA